MWWTNIAHLAELYSNGAGTNLLFRRYLQLSGQAGRLAYFPAPFAVGLGLARNLTETAAGIFAARGEKTAQKAVY
jgi:hypothetical protein